MADHKCRDQPTGKDSSFEQKERGINSLPKIYIPVAAIHTYSGQQTNKYVHSYEDQVTFRKKTEEIVIGEREDFKKHQEKEEVDRRELINSNKISEQQAKSQLLQASDSLRMKEAAIAIEMPKDTDREESSKNEISAFSMRQINYVKNMKARRILIKQEEVRDNVINSRSTGNLQEKQMMRQRTNMILDRLMAENQRRKKELEKQVRTSSMNVRDQTVELCRRALLKTKSIYMDLLQTNKHPNSSSSSLLKNHLDYSRRRRSKRSQDLECLHEVQYSKMMRQIEDIEGINNLLISTINPHEKLEDDSNQQSEKISKHIQKNSYVPHTLHKRVKFIQRKIKTTIQNHPSQEENDLNIIDGIGIRRHSTVELDHRGEEIGNISHIFKPRQKKNRCNSTMIQGKDVDTAKRYKMSKIIREKSSEFKDKESLQPISRSISYQTKQISPEKDLFPIQKSKAIQPNIRINLEVSNNSKKNIINSIKLFSQTRKTKNISDILALERNRFKMTYLMKEFGENREVS